MRYANFYSMPALYFFSYLVIPINFGIRVYLSLKHAQQITWFFKLINVIYNLSEVFECFSPATLILSLYRIIKISFCNYRSTVLIN